MSMLLDQMVIDVLNDFAEHEHEFQPILGKVDTSVLETLKTAFECELYMRHVAEDAKLQEAEAEALAKASDPMDGEHF